MFLLDTNIWLERLLGQEQMEVVERLLNTLNTDEICITDFCLHSIGVILGRLKKRPAFVQYVQDVLIDGHVLLVRIPPEKMLEITAVMDTFQLDFDDAYQYVAAQQVKATIISFDKDFDRTEHGRQTPQEVLKTLLSP